MDLFSYLLGKKSSGGGGTTPTGTINITENGEYDVTNYATANVNISGDIDWSAIGYSGTPENIVKAYNYSKNIYDNWNSSITSMNNMYMENRNLFFMPLVDTSNVSNMSLAFGYSNLMSLPLIDTSNVVAMNNTFNTCNNLETVPNINTSKCASYYLCFSSCGALKNIPEFNFSLCTSDMSLKNMFQYCPNLTDTSINNILKSCIGATSYAGTKTLKNLGFASTNYPASRIQALSSYQDFIDAGWTIGY